MHHLLPMNPSSSPQRPATAGLVFFHLIRQPLLTSNKQETCHIINHEVIDALGPRGVLINIGRGPHVDEPELVKALVEGRLGGAGLDVFEGEPKVPEELFGLDNVVLIPHVGSGTCETRKAMADLVLGNLEAHVLKKPLLTPVV